MSDWQDEDVLGKAYDARLMRRFLRYLRPHRGLVALSFGLVLIRIGLALVGPWIIARAIDGPIAHRDPRGFAVYVGLFVASIFAMAIFEVVEMYVTNLTGQRII